MTPPNNEALADRWSCDERNRSGCRNPHGCHCREITSLIVERDALGADLEKVQTELDAALRSKPSSAAVQNALDALRDLPLAELHKIVLSKKIVADWDQQYRDGFEAGKAKVDPAVEREAWQDINTAPNDGTGILAKLPDSDMPIVIRFDRVWRVAWDGEPLTGLDHPTHWKHIDLPARRKTAEGATHNHGTVNEAATAQYGSVPIEELCERAAIEGWCPKPEPLTTQPATAKAHQCDCFGGKPGVYASTHNDGKNRCCDLCGWPVVDAATAKAEAVRFLCPCCGARGEVKNGTTSVSGPVTDELLKQHCPPAQPPTLESKISEWIDGKPAAVVSVPDRTKTVAWGNLARQFDLMAKGCRAHGLHSQEDDFDWLRQRANKGDIDTDAIIEAIDYDYRTGQDGRAALKLFLDAIIADAALVQSPVPTEQDGKS